MIKRYTFWLWAAILFQILTAIFHSFSLFVPLEAVNDTERELLRLFTTYRLDAGAGFHPTFSNLFTALSSCFSFVCLFGGLINAYLLRQGTDAATMKGVTAINLVIFGSIFVVMAVLTFLPPIICTGLITVCSLAALLTNGGNSPKAK